jgi:lipopolysaccharide transport protein LptA
LAGADAKTAALKQVELFDAVHIVATESGQQTNVDAGYALYDKENDRYELKNGAHLTAAANGQPSEMTASTAVFEQTAHKLALTGSVEITQSSSYLKADAVYANLFPDNKIKHGVARGNAAARQATADRTTTVTAPQLNVSYNDARQLQDANAIGQSTVEIIPNGAADHSSVITTAVRGIGVTFKGDGLLDAMRTDGRTTVQLNAPNGAPDAANKRVTADVVRTTFAANGKDLSHAEAVGAAELYIEPLRSAPANYRTTVNAPRFDCDFYAGNDVKTCVGGKKTKTVRVPTLPAERRGTQTLLADQLTASFGETSRDVERLDAVGNAKFTELDRAANASQISYTKSDETVRLRGSEPTAWDSSARARAKEIDWNTREQRSYFRGGVSTTYYNRKQMGDAVPFASSDKPVFITADTAEVDHNAETGLYIGNARGWQENNFVRADRIFIRQGEGQLTAEGSVQSGLYNAKIKRNAKESTVPVFATAVSLNYDRETRVLRYRGSVDIRQGTDRITAESTDVYLDANNELARTVAETKVVMTQPGRRATGDWAQYTAEKETAILRGDPATVSDAENGTSQGGELSFNLRDHRVVGEGKTKQNPAARTRSVYKVKTNQ